MHVYLAGEMSTLKAPWWATHVPRRLMSYWYHGAQQDNRPSAEARAMHQHGVSLFLDSGAFTAETQKVTLHLADFVDYCRWNLDMWTVVASLDVIGDADTTWRNYAAMVEAGVTMAMPTFHFGEPWEALDRLVANAEYIALGGLVGRWSSDQRAWLDEAWTHIVDGNGFPRVKVHGFGLTNVPLMARYPWHSVDSSSWLKSAAYGSAMLWLGSPGKLVRIVFSDKSPSASELESWNYQALCQVPDDPRRLLVDAALQALGYDPQDAVKEYRVRMELNARAYRHYESLPLRPYRKVQDTFFT